MSLPRFVISEALSPETIEKIYLDKPSLHHARNVLRLAAGDQIEVFIKSLEKCYLADLTSINSQHAIVRLVSELEAPSIPPVTLLLGITRPKVIDTIVEKCTELGVSDFYFFAAERSQGHYANQGSFAQRLERMERVAEGALKQSGAQSTPRFRYAPGLRQALEELGQAISKALPGELRVICVSTGEITNTPPTHLAGQLTKITTSSSSISSPCGHSIDKPTKVEKLPESADSYIIVGPEGGLTPEETAVANQAGYVNVCLGPKTLRTETAAILASGLVLMLR